MLTDGLLGGGRGGEGMVGPLVHSPTRLGNPGAPGSGPLGTQVGIGITDNRNDITGCYKKNKNLLI